MICLNDTYNKYDFFEDKGKYSMFDTSCQRFWIHITKFLVSRIHKNKNHEWWAHCKLTKQYAVPSNKAAIDCITEGWRTVSFFERNNGECFVSCVQTKRIMSSPSEDLYGSKNKMFSMKHMLPYIFCGHIFYGWFLIFVWFDVLRRFSGVSVIISGILVMIGLVREIRHMYWFAVPTSEEFFKVIII